MNITNAISGTVDLNSGVITILDEETRSPGLSFEDPMAPLVQHYKQVLDTKERLVREALIKLGWTPPGGAPAMLHSKREG